MKAKLCSLLLVGLSTFGCKNDREPDSTAKSYQDPLASIRSENESTLATSAEREIPANFLTIKRLKKMSEAELYDLVRKKATAISCVPEGWAAGTPGRLHPEVIDPGNTVQYILNGVFKALGDGASNLLADQVWGGKIFEADPIPTGAQCSKSGRGVNRILGLKLITMNNRVFSSKEYLAEEPKKESRSSNKQRLPNTDESSFRKALFDNARSKGTAPSLVELNYSKPCLDPGSVGGQFGVRDMMVPIDQGDGSVIFVGRAYTGNWNSAGDEFISVGNLAWFFLDFTERGLKIEPLIGKLNRKHRIHSHKTAMKMYKALLSHGNTSHPKPEIVPRCNK